jgi:hypothetical protein
VPSALTGTEYSVRDFPPSNKVPTWSFIMSPGPHDPGSVLTACPQGQRLASNFSCGFGEIRSRRRSIWPVGALPHLRRPQFFRFPHSRVLPGC